MEENKRILAPNKRYKKADEQDLNQQLSLESSESLMRLGDRDIVLDLEKLFNKERQDSNEYKIFGKMKMVFRNMYSGSTDYNYLRERLYLSGDGSDGVFTGFLPYDEFAFLRRDLYRQVTSNTGTTSTFAPSVSYVGSLDHTNVTAMSAPYHNWNIYLSYVYSGNSQYSMIYTLSGTTKTEGNNILHFQSGHGIPFRVSNSDGYYYELTSPIEHGMNEGEYISLSGVSYTGTQISRTYRIDSVGNENYNSEKYVINISKSQFTTQNLGLGTNILFTGKRVLDITNLSGTTSNYYVHLHKTLTSVDDYILDYSGFESPIFEHEKKLLFENSANENDVLVERNRPEAVLFDFKNTFTLSGITNNLGYTPTEVYLTAIYKNGNGFFNYPHKSGFKFNFHNSWIDEHFSGTTHNETSLGSGTTFTKDGHTFVSGNSLPIGTSGLTGAFVEYNKKELKERIICESVHKLTNPTTIFNHGQNGDVTGFSGATSNNLFGLYYHPHHRIKLRELSPYIENVSTNQIYDLPENAIYDADEKMWRYRDVYEHGYIDTDGNGTNHPFVNGQHYVRADINFYLKNERYYTNKADGIIEFTDSNNKRNKNLFNC